jgi:hypothetical protein
MIISLTEYADNDLQMMAFVMGEDRGDNLIELYALSGEEEAEIGIREWLSMELGMDSVTLEHLEQWVDEQTEMYL